MSLVCIIHLDKNLHHTEQNDENFQNYSRNMEVVVLKTVDPCDMLRIPADLIKVGEFFKVKTISCCSIFWCK